jgi:hypothetical protein
VGLGSKCSQVQKAVPSKRTKKKNKCRKLVTSYLQMKKQKQNQQIEMQQEKKRSET